MVSVLQAVSVKAYTDTDPVLGLLDLVKRELGIHPDTVFEECQPDRRTRSFSPTSRKIHKILSR